MAINNNCANRVYNIFQKVTAKRNMTILQAWQEVFEIDSNETEFYVVEALKHLREEINKISPKMEAEGFSENLYEPYIRQLLSTTDIGHLTSNWDTVNSKITRETKLSLRYMMEIIPPDEIGADKKHSFSKTELNELLKQVNELEKEFYSSSNKVPYELKEFIKKLLKACKSALINYEISGNEALKEFFSQVFFIINTVDSHEKASIIKSNNNTPIFQKLLSVLNTFYMYSERLKPMESYLKMYKNMLEHGQEIVKLFLGSN